MALMDTSRQKRLPLRLRDTDQKVEMKDDVPTGTIIINKMENFWIKITALDSVGLDQTFIQYVTQSERCYL